MAKAGNLKIESVKSDGTGGCCPFETSLAGFSLIAVLRTSPFGLGNHAGAQYSVEPVETVTDAVKTGRQGWIYGQDICCEVVSGGPGSVVVLIATMPGVPAWTLPA
jgi:hypothetical protein